MNKKLEINISKQKEIFKEHLNLPDNQRIIFSGQFGCGKTYFLNEFFKDNEDYFCVKISTVNYSVSSNEDIFNLIKYDIIEEINASYNYELFDILKEELKEKIGTKNIFYNKIKNLYNVLTLKKVAKAIQGFELQTTGGLNIVGVGLLNQIILMMDEYEKNNQIFEGGFDNAQLAKEFYQLMKKHFSKEDEISYFVRALLDKIVDMKENKVKKVLIIDDLDRIDPHHIFRIFNVFACQNNLDDENKFGFDKIILCCDIKNIREIFAKFYGQNTDFNGYIDKFYSKYIFYYDITDDLFKSLFKYLDITDGLRNSMKLLLKPMLTSKHLSTRSFVKKNIMIGDIDDKIENSSFRRSDKWDSVINSLSLKFIILLSNFFPSHQIFREVIEKSKINFYDDEELNNYIIPEFLGFLLDNKNLKRYFFSSSPSGETTYAYSDEYIRYEFQIQDYNYSDRIIKLSYKPKKEENDTNTIKNLINTSVLEMALKCVDILIENKVIV